MSHSEKSRAFLAGVVCTIFFLLFLHLPEFLHSLKKSVVGEAEVQEQVSSTDLVVCARGLPEATGSPELWTVSWRTWPNSMGYDSFVLTPTDQGACGIIDFSGEVNSAFSVRLQGPYRLNTPLLADPLVEPGASLVAGFKVHGPGPEPGYIDLQSLDIGLVGDRGPTYALPISLWEDHAPQGLTVTIPSRRDP